MSRILKFLSSSVLALLLLLAFGISMAVATFVENDFGTAAAWAVIYNAWWFEMVMVGLCISFIANIFKYNLWRKAKWPLLLFHLAFICIIVGAGITRYTSYSGVMRIRENAISNTMISSENYLTVHLENGQNRKQISKHIEFTTLRDNYFQIRDDFEQQDITISYDDYIPDAEADVVQDEENGKPILELVVTKGDGRNTIYLTKGEKQSISEQFTIGFEVEEEGIVNITEEEGYFKVHSPEQLSYFVMSTQQTGMIDKDSVQDMTLRTLYRSGDVSFVPLSYQESGKFQLNSTATKPKDNDKTKDDALVLKVKVGEEEKQVNLLYREGFLPIESDVEFGDLKIRMSYGSRALRIPFRIRLNDFQLERYPGSSSPSSYASEVTVLDGQKQIPYRIFMNNVLDYNGYRFFQASYDTDERGTVLSVNRDWLGTWVTYFGYLLMGIGMFFTLFNKQSRFSMINRKLKKLKQTALIIGLLFISIIANTRNIDSLVQSQMIDKDHADLFGRLLVQDLDGRIKPINTLASEFIRKISRKSKFVYPIGDEKITYDVNQVFLAMNISPNDWQYIPMIKVDIKKTADLLSEVRVGANGLIAFSELLDDDGGYILSAEVEEANQKKPAVRNELDKEVLKIDEKFNILYNLFLGNYLKIFPKKDDDTKTWYSFTHDFEDFVEEDAQFTRSIIPSYFSDIIKKDYNNAYEKLDYIKTYQDILGAEIIPDSKRVEAELWYNKMNLNFWMFQVLFTIGFIMLILSIVKMFYHPRWLEFIWNVFVVLSLISFLVFAGNIILRWYVSQHAPWSNGYEMLVFVALILLLSGLLTFRRSDFALPLAALFSGALLFVSYLDWLSPEITNLMPVLKSYWLKIHVATIVSSYAPLALSAMLGLMALILSIFRSQSNRHIIDLKVQELSYVNEMSMTIGLYLLSIGTFLGGVWANESWGRYWAWDPKETWALISIIVYAIVLHLRLVPKLNNNFTLNVASMFAFWSIIMTSFGVNYYLTGLHSYATGDPVPIPSFVYFVAGFMILIAVIAGLKYRRRV